MAFMKSVLMKAAADGFGCYQCLRMPFGLSLAPQEFESTYVSNRKNCQT